MRPQAGAMPARLVWPQPEFKRYSEWTRRQRAFFWLKVLIPALMLLIPPDPNTPLVLNLVDTGALVIAVSLWLLLFAWWCFKVALRQFRRGKVSVDSLPQSHPYWRIERLVQKIQERKEHHAKCLEELKKQRQEVRQGRPKQQSGMRWSEAIAFLAMGSVGCLSRLILTVILLSAGPAGLMFLFGWWSGEFGREDESKMKKMN